MKSLHRKKMRKNRKYLKCLKIGKVYEISKCCHRQTNDLKFREYFHLIAVLSDYVLNHVEEDIV